MHACRPACMQVPCAPAGAAASTAGWPDQPTAAPSQTRSGPCPEWCGWGPAAFDGIATYKISRAEQPWSLPPTRHHVTLRTCIRQEADGTRVCDTPPSQRGCRSAEQRQQESGNKWTAAATQCVCWTRTQLDAGACMCSNAVGLMRMQLLAQLLSICKPAQEPSQPAPDGR